MSVILLKHALATHTLSVVLDCFNDNWLSAEQQLLDLKGPLTPAHATLLKSCWSSVLISYVCAFL